MRKTMIDAATLAVLAACQPAPAAAPETEPAAGIIEEPAPEASEAATFEHAALDGAARLVIEEPGADLSFGATCAAAGGPSLTLTGEVSQVAMGNMTVPYAIVLSGESFPAELMTGGESDEVFSVTAPLTPEMLTALGATTTARIFVNDGYAFVESGIDPDGEFERFAAACAALTGLTPAP